MTLVDLVSRPCAATVRPCVPPLRRHVRTCVIIWLSCIVPVPSLGRHRAAPVRPCTVPVPSCVVHVPFLCRPRNVMCAHAISCGYPVQFLRRPCGVPALRLYPLRRPCDVLCVPALSCGYPVWFLCRPWAVTVPIAYRQTILTSLPRRLTRSTTAMNSSS